MKISEITIEEEFRKNPQLNQAILEDLRRWIQKEHPLCPHPKDLELVAFLHTCNYDLGYTKTVFTCYLSCLLKSPEFFSNFDLENPIFKITLNTQLTAPLTKQINGELLLLSKFIDHTPSNFHLAEIVKKGFMLQLLMLHQYGTTAGLQVICDMSGFTVSHMARLNLFQLRKMMVFIQDGAPVRVNRMHFVNAQAWMDKLFALIKSLLRRQWADMIQVHTNFDSLHKLIPKEYLPKEYGGTEGDLTQLKDNVERLFKDNVETLEVEDARIARYRDAVTHARSSKSVFRWRNWI